MANGQEFDGREFAIDDLADLADLLRDSELEETVMPVELDEIIKQAARLGIRVPTPPLPSDAFVFAQTLLVERPREWSRTVHNTFLEIAHELNTMHLQGNRSTEIQSPTSTKIDERQPAHRKETPKQSTAIPTIEKIERKTPELDVQSIEWVAARKENQEKLGYPTGTLATYRLATSGGRQLSAYFGIDKDGRRWRRRSDKTETSTVYYFASDLKKHRSKVSN